MLHNPYHTKNRLRIHPNISPTLPILPTVHRQRAVKKKSVRQQSSISSKGRSLKRDLYPEDYYQRAIQQKAAVNNVHSFGSSFGLTGDDISYLENQYTRVYSILETNERSLRTGYEVRTYTLTVLTVLLGCINILLLIKGQLMWSYVFKSITNLFTGLFS